MKGFLLCESCIHVSETGTCIRYGYVGHRACSYVLPLPLFCVGCELKIRGLFGGHQKGGANFAAMSRHFGRGSPIKLAAKWTMDNSGHFD